MMRLPSNPKNAFEILRSLVISVSHSQWLWSDEPEAHSVQMYLFTSHPALIHIPTSSSTSVILSLELSIPYLITILNFILVTHISKY